MTRDTDLIRRSLVKHNRDLLLDQANKAMPDSGDEELDHGHRMYRAGIRDLARRLMLAPAHLVQEPPSPQPGKEVMPDGTQADLVEASPGVTAGATGMVADDSLNARLHEVGNQIHNIACEHQSNEDMVERLGDLRAEIWAIAAMLPATPAPVVPADQRAAIEALADRMWRVHPKDIHAAGYEHLERGGKYENPRAAWYADQIEALFKQFRDQVSPVVPAEGLVAAMREAIDLLTERKQGSSARSPGHNARLVLESALRSAPPVGARVIAEKAYLAGFNAAGEGYNGEWPFHDKGISPDTDEGWLIGRDMALAALLPAGEGEE